MDIDRRTFLGLSGAAIATLAARGSRSLASVEMPSVAAVSVPSSSLTYATAVDAFWNCQMSLWDRHVPGEHGHADGLPDRAELVQSLERLFSATESAIRGAYAFVREKRQDDNSLPARIEKIQREGNKRKLALIAAARPPDPERYREILDPSVDREDESVVSSLVARGEALLLEDSEWDFAERHSILEDLAAIDAASEAEMGRAVRISGTAGELCWNLFNGRRPGGSRTLYIPTSPSLALHRDDAPAFIALNLVDTLGRVLSSFPDEDGKGGELRALMLQTIEALYRRHESVNPYRFPVLVSQLEIGRRDLAVRAEEGSISDSYRDHMVPCFEAVLRAAQSEVSTNPTPTVAPHGEQERGGATSLRELFAPTDLLTQMARLFVTEHESGGEPRVPVAPHDGKGSAPPVPLCLDEPRSVSAVLDTPSQQESVPVGHERAVGGKDPS